MTHAFVFPGQGSQFPGMGKDHYENSAFAKRLFEQANEIVGFRISDIMFNGTEEDLKQTRVTQPAIFLHSVIAFKSIDNARPEMVAGHSLGEFSALVANGVLSFEDGLKLVSVRAQAMQKACETNPSTMAAVLGLDDAKVEEICALVQEETKEVVVPANYNCPGQLVISGSIKGIEVAIERLKAAGAKRALVLPVSGAFHSPLMESAKAELSKAIEAITFYHPNCPVYQNVAAKAVGNKEDIKQNLIDQLTSAVKWTQSIKTMITDGGDHFTECGPGKVLQGLIGKIDKKVTTDGVS
ncbi:[acyl-carrier-protein] S-malonyltransferase [Niastella yeongjuensis]|uniref:Malonyl CoA-acyl carrier protein transacylase n=1 Tax=Niastella yeongjuensis TaxID=354355 RepID=A0A1V9EZ02_9BACT|nr:ACP S-malonyltransferase [Niastella yeongjuensis]OQP51298.1 [acyl-carrier-protein] S-malonyltransferase [Niastella yeongjuensis]SEP39146.1 [acyl-carrier-protein] S-malonyltransferase [Niastella yeongjuensis]